MTIYNIFDYAENINDTHEGESFSSSMREKGSHRDNYIQDPTSKKDAFLSAFFARLFFLCLLSADILWGTVSFALFSIKLLANVLTLFRSKRLFTSLKKSTLAVKRSIVCFIALTIAIISPALGIMFSCMYFLMYDKNGVDEIVPASLKGHFKEILPHSPFC
jgi:hypothetical protein